LHVEAEDVNLKLVKRIVTSSKYGEDLSFHYVMRIIFVYIDGIIECCQPATPNAVISNNTCFAAHHFYKFIATD